MAFCNANATASIIASEVNVAPDTTSTLGVLAETIASGTPEMAGSLIPGVSSWAITFTSTIFPPSTVT